jgi:hypothetical protein
MRTHALRTAEDQGGLITRIQALACGMTMHEITRELQTGRWEEVQPFVYRIVGAPQTWVTQLRAATLTAADAYEQEPALEVPRVVASHTSAATLLGIERGMDDSKIEVTGVGLSLPIRRGVTVHRTRRLDPCDVTIIDGIPCVTAARYLVDVAGSVDLVELTALTDDVHSARSSARSWTYRRAQALKNGRKDVGMLMRLTAPGAREVFNSWLEQHVAERLSGTDLPPPLWNHELRVDGKLLGIVDTFWEQGRTLSVEWDGLRFHSSPKQLREDKARDRAMTIAGYPPLRYTWLDVMTRWDEILAEIRAALHHRGVST